MKANTYLQTIREQLTMKPAQADNIIAEIKAHLQDQYQLHLINGADIATATEKSIAEFGQPNVVAARFNKTYSRWLHAVWLIIALPIIAYTVIRLLLLVDIFSSDNHIGRLSGLTIGPGFNDRMITLVSCVGFALGAILMARFVYHYLSQITVSPKVLQLHLLLSTVLISSYHTVFSFTKFCVGMVLEADYYDGNLVYNHFIPFYGIQVTSVFYYFLSNIVYIMVTTVVLATTMQLTFRFLQKHQARAKVIA